MAAFSLIVGLGNPSPRYEKTRHNAGFWFLDELVSQCPFSFVQDDRWQGFVGKISFQNETVFFLKPMTFMNHSGRSVGLITRYFRIQPEKILVAHDELDFDAGVVRLKFGGGHGGHNGLKDVIEQIGSRNFYRLRIGIGRPDDGAEVVSYVLGKSSKAEEQKLRARLADAAAFVPDLLRGRIDGVMNQLHSDL